MASARPFQAVSLDLWYTTLFPGPGDERRWNEDRVKVLEAAIVSSDRKPFERHQIDAALKETRAALESETRPLESIDPQRIVEQTVQRLGGRWRIPPDEAGRSYSSAGLVEHPPRINPEATALVRRLSELGIPVVSITNTARRESSWREFFAARKGPHFEHIITSCEVGRIKPDRAIFQEAARRLGLSPSQVVHIGDRWDLDVEGARGSGMGAVLYRGLWSLYPEGLYPDVREVLREEDGAAHPPSVIRVDRLEEVLESGWFSGEEARSTPARSALEKTR